jgi:uncharacterized protein with GYD domain
MPTFLCFLNWTDQGAKNTKDIVKRYQASKAVVEKLGGADAQCICDDRPV